MNLVKFKIRLKNLNERLIRLQLPELCVDIDADTIKAVMDKKPPRRKAARREDRIKLALVEMRGTLETAAQLVKDIEEGGENSITKSYREKEEPAKTPKTRVLDGKKRKPETLTPCQD